MRWAIKTIEREVIAYVVVASMIMLSLMIQCENNTARVFLFLIFSFGLFIAFKGGFVRHDGHAVIAAIYIVFSALVLNVLYPSMASLCVLLASILCNLYIDASYIRTATPTLLPRFEATFRQAWTGIALRRTDPAALEQRFLQTIETMKPTFAIPKLDGTADIYSFNQSNLIASGNAWAPRPVFQSYSAYTPYLGLLNAAHLSGEDAADNILFRLEPLDRRLPASMDGASWPAILDRYTLDSFRRGILYLRRTDAPRGLTQTTLGTTRGTVGAPVTMPETGDAIFAKIDIRHTLLGTLANTLFKSPQLRIALTLDDGGTREYRYVAGTGKAGVLLDPLIETTGEFGLLYTGTEGLSGKRVRSFTVNVNGSSLFWGSEFDVEFIALDLPREPEALERLAFGRPSGLPAAAKLAKAPKCHGHIDSLNGASPAPRAMTAGETLQGNGWLVKSGPPEAVPETVQVLLTSANGRRYAISTEPGPRPDIVTAFGNPGLSLAGYSFTATLGGLNGTYRLELGYEEDDSVYVCSEFGVNIDIQAP